MHLPRQVDQNILPTGACRDKPREVVQTIILFKKENYMRHGVAATAKQQPQVPAYGKEAPPRMMNDKKTE